ncbi:MAG: D-glycerate dehydrogenase [Betaproteobacteria bacterium]|jgi:lactate dehydrogenase-like 2-hydroxyacid dehydrogenase|nr:D-glycerate dehydrogenase [Betaproteobacteria bacterium]
MRPRVLVTLGIFPELLAQLRTQFEVEDNQTDRVLSPAELVRRLGDKDGALITGYDRIDASLLETCPRLKAACNLAVGYNNMDLPACTAHGVIATNTPDVLNDTTADLAFALLLAAARRITEAERWLRAGHWEGWRNDQMLGQDVHHATLGIVGMGQIGRAIARRAHGFDMRIIYHNRGRAPVELERALGARRVELDELLGTADFVCLALPYSPETHHLIDARRLGLMKANAILVNVGRGGLVDDAALVEALRTRRIAGAGLDVYEGEPALHAGFLALDNVALTPHIGSATRATRMQMGAVAAENLTAALSGRRPPNLLNPEVWEHRRR